MNSNKQNSTAIPVAVVGMSAIYPGEPGLAGYWRTVAGGRDAISEVPPSHWLIEDYFDPDPNAPDKTYCKRGGFIDPVPFDPVQFGLPPNALPATDSAQLLALITAKQLLDQAMHPGAAVDLDRVDVVLGVASTTELVCHMNARLQRPIWRKAMLENGLPEDETDQICHDIAEHYAPWQESTFPGLLGNVVAGRIANRLNLGGSNYVTDAACASSLSALQVALHRLYLDEADLVLTGGVDALNDVMMYMCFSKTPAFSPTGDCRPFSDAADGTIIGEGVGMLALKRLSDAERDGDPIHAVIRGLGSSSDGRASSVYAPRPEGQAKALRRAYERAGYSPSTVELLEAHGTATKAGDVAEFAALKSVFAGADGRCAIGSVKSQIGHTKAAAGAAGLIKAVLALQHSTLPATLKVERPNPALGLAQSPFYVNAATRPWVRNADGPRRASVSSFGFGGSNFHVALEEYRGTQRAKRLRALPSELVVLSGSCEADLEKRCAAIAAAVRAGESLARIAFESAHVFDASHAARTGLVAADNTSLEKLVEQLRNALAEGTATDLKDANIALGFGPARPGKTAFLFPGQGSQYVGMGADLALAFPESLGVWDELGRDLADVQRVVFPEPVFDAASLDTQQAELTAMANAQPAIAATSLAQLALLDVLGVTADAAAGHSFGEVTALAAAGVLPRDQLVETAHQRGVLMTEAARDQDGAMLAVAASAKNVLALLDTQPELAARLVVANDNAPDQVVLAGRTSDIARAEVMAKSAGWTSFRLPVATAFHSPVVAAGRDPFAAYLNTIKFAAADFPVYANATAQPYGQQVADQLADQLQKPVRFREMIEAMARDGVTRFIEVGPGRILTGLVGKILSEAPHLAVALDDPKAGGLRGWHRGLAKLAADGVPLHISALFDDYEVPAKHAPTPAHAVMVGGANLGKPYPQASGKSPITPKRQRVDLSAASRLGAEEPAPTPVPQRIDIPVALPSAQAWTLIDSVQKETAEQHQHYLDVMTQSHQAFLDMSAQMLAQIVGDPANAPQVSVPAPAVLPQPPLLQAPDMTGMPTAPESLSPPTTAYPRPSAGVAEHLPVPAAAEIVLEIVSEKTGYPADMLGLDMEMEAELGIDSIKQVEILSALQARFPNAPEIPASELASLRTLQDVADSVAGPAPSTCVENLSVQQHSDARRAPWAGDAAADVVLAVVSEKTGYPADMLGLDMEMEAELGIDSIKQVEILSALQARFPNAPEIPASELASLRTLQDVADAIAGLASSDDDERLSAQRHSPQPHPSSTGLCCTEASLRALPPNGFAMAGLRDGEILITREDPRFADALERAMTTRGLKARTVDEVPEEAGAVICLAALATAGSPMDCVKMHVRTFHAARSVANSSSPSRLFVTVQSTGAGFAGSDVPVGVASIVKTAACEWPNASVRAVDIESPDAERLTDELLAGGSGLEVALRDDGTRMVIEDVETAPVASETICATKHGVVVVSGGGRGVTAASALALAARHGLRLALLGRTALSTAAPEKPGGATVAEAAAALVASARARGEVICLPQARALAESLLAEREIRQTLSAAEQQGIAARYFAADITDREQLRSTLDEVRRSLGPIVGVVHGAGVLADKRLVDLDDDQFVRVFNTKVIGAETLLDATSCDDLRFISLFSSVAARAGNVGQSAYAASNAALEAIAARESARRGSACVVRAFGWGPWDGGMVDDMLKSRFLNAGVGVIAIDEGAEFFAEHALRQSPTPAIVVSAPAARRRRGTRLEWEVSTESLPVLADHQIRGRVVVPVVIVLDAMLRAARGLVGEERPVVRDFRVLSGVTFAAFEQQPIVLTLEFEPSGSSYTATIRDREGRQRYSALLETESDERTGPLVPEMPESPWPMRVDDAYAGPLFHGPSFAAIEQLDAFAAAGGTGQLKGLRNLGWPESDWAIDPAAVDGGLQLGLLWASALGRSLILPQRIGRVIVDRSFPENGLLHCRFAARPLGDKRVDFDFEFETTTGGLVAALEGVECYAVSAAGVAW
ncbi:Mycocerosic acid synthase-like polyketide synthase [Mycobacterium simulans]|uniref:type I polyketide synthase n=1 Tax=Mycobacterium simulans TaxID=627089 RepID=UPI00174DA275|nr:type I polyketide synthase [Mycobacterium simulans]SON60447.1 Mycocerosic acid synthase-like polyketide synthase [Mycobacterium simulans]